jgi:NADPH:quinone reductase-like Zn-dependent oxidoreductase
MKAWTIRRYGGPEVLALEEIEKPQVKPGKILIEVHAASLNPYDYKLRNGIAKVMTGRNFPIVLGGDFAGVVIESMDKQQRFAPGQEVYGFANLFFREQGSLAEFTSISPKFVRPLPTGSSLIDACAMPSAGLTALSGLRKCGEFENKKVLIVGATGGVGHLATQIVATKGGIVTAVCSTDNVDLARDLGAGTVIDYRKRGVFDDGEVYDVIYDAAAKSTYSQAKRHLCGSGIYCTTEEGAGPAIQLLLSKLSFRTSMSLSSFRGKMDDFEELEAFMSNGVKPAINKIFPFGEVDDAFRLLESGRANGKIVVRVKAKQ